jgi:hypothetical protein
VQLAATAPEKVPGEQAVQDPAPPPAYEPAPHWRWTLPEQ